MFEKEASRYAGEASWETPERKGTAQVVCTVPSADRLKLELAWNDITYMVWLDHVERGVYSGIYEIVKLRTLLRGKATCSLKPNDTGVEVRGIFEEQFRDYIWQGRLIDMSHQPSANRFAVVPREDASFPV
jgi:hypothetical protein